MFLKFNEFINESRKDFFDNAEIKSFPSLTAYRSENVLDMYKGKSVFGDGKYFSLDKKSSEILSNDSSSIEKYKLQNLKNIAVFKVIFSDDYNRAKKDFDILMDLWDYEKSSNTSIDKIAKKENIDGIMIYTDSLQWGLNQIVLFPHGKAKYQPV